MKSLTPGQQVVKIVHEELTRIMGGGDSRLAFAGRPPTVIVLVGLQGAGKTTAAGKLALMLRKDGRSPLLVAADLQRPAAVTQLEQLGRELRPRLERRAHGPGQRRRASGSSRLARRAATSSSSIPPGGCTSTTR